jgi:hypothetical protein
VFCDWAIFHVTDLVSVLDLLPGGKVNCLLFGSNTLETAGSPLPLVWQEVEQQRGWPSSLAFTTMWRFTAYLFVVNTVLGDLLKSRLWQTVLGAFKKRSYQPLEGNVFTHCSSPDIGWKTFRGWRIMFLFLNGIFLGSSPTYCVLSPYIEDRYLVQEQIFVAQRIKLPLFFPPSLHKCVTSMYQFFNAIYITNKFLKPWTASVRKKDKKKFGNGLPVKKNLHKHKNICVQID